jgi:hypothetical protein
LAVFAACRTAPAASDSQAARDAESKANEAARTLDVQLAKNERPTPVSE